MKIIKIWYLFFFLTLFFYLQAAFAEISVPRLLSDGLILQRDSKVKLWGWASEGEAIKAELDGKQLGSTMAKHGKWEIYFQAPEAGGPHQISIQGGKNTLMLNDIYFGDIWLASGQSNMQTSMARVEEMFPEEISKANYPLIRQFTVPRELRFDKPAEDFSDGSWQQSTPEYLAQHSAVAYFFAKQIHLDKNIPIGILSANFGGSPAECWINEQVLKEYPTQYKTAKSYQDADYLQTLKDADKKDSDKWHAELNGNDLGLKENPAWYHDDIDHSSWETIHLPAKFQEQNIDPMSGIVWLRKTIRIPEQEVGKPGLLRLGTIVDADKAYINGVEVGSTGYQYPPRRYKFKAGILRAGKNTISLRVQVNNKRGEFTAQKPYYLAVGDSKIDLTGRWHYKIGNIVAPPPPLRYVPWSQPLGCFNAMLAPLTNMTIKGALWYQGESNTARPEEYSRLFPQLISHWRDIWQQGDFPFLFVQLPNFGSSSGLESGWPEMRQVQLQTLKKTSNTAMVVTIDVGEWNDLHPLDKKSVGERLALAAEALAYDDKKLVYSGPVFKSISAKKNKLKIDFNFVGDGLIARGKKLGCFEVAEDRGEYFPANATIKNNQVVVWNKDISQPTKIRYAWRDSPDCANLYNKNGLPASPFAAEL
ncbi:sialate O-acetylesterase [Alteromonadaceae bacterium Bs31]|nr:sialate O-acetylesterase [Alteromonadaceae bacterium Bs31]